MKLEILESFKQTNAYKNLYNDPNVILIYIGGSYTNMPYTVHTDYSDIDIIVLYNDLYNSNTLDMRYKYQNTYIDIIKASIKNYIAINEMTGNEGIFKNSFLKNNIILYENPKYKKICDILKNDSQLISDMQKIGLFGLFENLKDIRFKYNCSILTQIFKAYEKHDIFCLHLYRQNKTKYFANLYQYYCIYFNETPNLDLIKKLKLTERLSYSELATIINMLKKLKNYSIHNAFDYISMATQWNDKLTELVNNIGE